MCAPAFVDGCARACVEGRADRRRAWAGRRPGGILGDVRRLTDPTRRLLLASACALCVAATPTLAGVCAPAASAASFNEGGALNNLTEGQETETETSTTSTAAAKTSESDTTSASILFIVVGAAVLLLAGVAFVIFRDARRVAPASDVELAAGGGVARHSEAALRRRRAKAKAARRQRKRNR